MSVLGSGLGLAAASGRGPRSATDPASVGASIRIITNLRHRVHVTVLRLAETVSTRRSRRVSDTRVEHFQHHYKCPTFCKFSGNSGGSKLAVLVQRLFVCSRVWLA
jgi:hypothetical protein